MTQLLKQKPCLFRLILKGNILLGLLLFVAAVYLTLTGQYENLAMRQQTESLLNVLAIGSLLYVVAFWYLAVFTKPFFACKTGA
ncbi:MAG: hypothetical protein OEY67_06955 [Gammaproteobacteria bacterium]|nr:hypothetical protein [Gammaproteobacteria bacterium]